MSPTTTSQPPKPPSRRSSPRKVGGQAGNLNAYKHGFYARDFPTKDLADLDSVEFTGLLDEIKLLRVHIRRLVELNRQSDDFADALNLLRGLCLACSCINRLIKTQHFLVGSVDPVSKAIMDSLDELISEGFIKNPSLSSSTPHK